MNYKIETIEGIGKVMGYKLHINGVGEEYADLLEAAGVDTVPESAQRKAHNILDALTKINTEKKLVCQVTILNAVKG